MTPPPVHAVSAALHRFLQCSDARHALADAEDPTAFGRQLCAGVDGATPPIEAEPAAATQLFQSLAPIPYTHQLAVILVEWAATGSNPLASLPDAAAGATELSVSRERVLSVPFEAVSSLVQACTLNDSTVGSRVLCPLTRQQCVESFTRSHGREKLTVGARAFTKHCQRSADGWWGVVKGGDAAKNATALAKLEELLATCVWRNVHSLPHSEATFEIRNARGFGARWYVCDASFRGFLEPPMANGHENRWRH
ncbi:hypothetical protein P43SY_005504 [Pythium insidiosum]|uniref:Uncharacterized protein n=1 Tax=Pythium insidiosum TaxID=114742 RepID=A0AAD5LQE7_PYTIN|nr:hypothetical protein P43SY_005504 [Pythium insidiosum]